MPDNLHSTPQGGPAFEALAAELREAVRMACLAQYVPVIIAGRNRVLALPRPWVIQHLEAVSHEVVTLTDPWEYRRLLELADLIDTALLRRFVAIGLSSTDEEVREAATEFAVSPQP